MPYHVLPVTRYALNCSIVWCEQTQRAAAIDPGGDHGDILSFLDLMELTIDVVLITHGHFDHAGGAARFAELTDARIEGPHRGDAHLIHTLPEVGARHGAPARTYEPARWLEDGDTVSFGRETLEVLHCPGHCHGHVAYFHRNERRAYVGDILFRHAIGAWEHPDGDLARLIASIREKLFPLGDDVVFVPGHGPESTFGHERRENPFVGEAAFRRG